MNKENFEILSEKVEAVYKKTNGFIKYLNATIIKGTKFKERVQSPKK